MLWVGAAAGGVRRGGRETASRDDDHAHIGMTTTYSFTLLVICQSFATVATFWNEYSVEAIRRVLV